MVNEKQNFESGEKIELDLDDPVIRAALGPAVADVIKSKKGGGTVTVTAVVRCETMTDGTAWCPDED